MLAPMRSTRSWGLAGLGAASLLSLLAACGDPSEPFVIVLGGTDAGEDGGEIVDASSDATVPSDGSVQDASNDAADDATVQDTGADAGTDAGADGGTDAHVDAGASTPDGSTVVTIGDAQVTIPALDPSLLGDGGIRVSDGGLAGADGGTLTPREFRDLVNGITCQRAQECCCPGCSASDLATPGAGFSQSKCTTGLGAIGPQLVLVGNESIPSASLVADPAAALQCLSLLNAALVSCQSLESAKVADLRAVCLRSFVSNKALGSVCANAYDCAMPARCRAADGGALTCLPMLSAGDVCTGSSDCSARTVQGTPPNYCTGGDGGTCQPYIVTDAVCSNDFSCGAGACTTRADGSKRCSTSLPFAAVGDPASFCTKYAP
jgi:hypothetical protein